MNLKMHKRSNKGFTLIELLVVVAIIGLLASVVLASLNSARGKAKDAAIKQSVHEMASLMALNYNDYGSYCQLQYAWITASGAACNAIFSGTYASKGQQICSVIYNNAAENNWGAPGAFKIYSYGTNCAIDYSFMVYLNDGNWYCSGSSGAKGEYAAYTSQPGCYNNP